MGASVSNLEAYRNWRRSMQMPCVFARFMTSPTGGDSQKYVELHGNAANNVAAEIEREMSAAVKEPELQALSILLPTLQTLELVVETTLELSKLPHWKVTRRWVELESKDRYVAFAVTRSIPAHSGLADSEILVMGQFDAFPVSRRAPFTAFEVYVGHAPGMDAKTRLPTTRANLANVQLRTIPNGSPLHDTLWEKTKVERRTILGGIDDPRAKAKVSFVIPASLATKMQVEP